MEEIKKEGEMEKPEGCEHHCANVHRFCGRRFCLARVLVAVILLGGAFAVGVCVGAHDGRGYRDGFSSYGSRDFGGYGGHMMMWGGAYPDDNVYYYGNTRMMGGRAFDRAIPVQGVPTTSAVPTQVVPATVSTPL